MSRLIDADALWMDVIHSMDYCDDFLEFIERQPTIEPEPRWIPCRERLPEDGRVVLWCNEHGSVFATAITARRGESWAVGKRHRRSKIIAWMPLPEPYRSEGDDKHEG